MGSYCAKVYPCPSSCIEGYEEEDKCPDCNGKGWLNEKQHNDWWEKYNNLEAAMLAWLCHPGTEEE